MVDVTDYKLKESHTFQEALSSSSKEFFEILDAIRTKIRLETLKGEAPKFAKDIMSDKGTDYNSINFRTRRVVSEEFYNRHKDNLAAVLGQDNLDTLKRLEAKNEFLEYITLTEKVGARDGSSTFVYETCFGSGGMVDFIDELCKGAKPKVGDRLCLGSSFLEDPEFGKLEKREVYLYGDDGKYKHIAQNYLPLRDDLTLDQVVDTTKTMQAKDSKNMTQEAREL